jgi:glutamate 5-kinase
MKTLVVKIGTSTLIREGAVDEEFLRGIAKQVRELRDEAPESAWRTVIVTSGAVRVGLDVIGKAKATTLAEKQAAAAIGQSLLMRSYRRAFDGFGLPVAQLLLTRADVADRRRFLNARHTTTQLFKWGVVPIVNENDTVATEEIRFGDNDTLASLSALVAEAHQVLLLSDVDGFYLPGKEKPESCIERITSEVEAAAGGAGSIGGTGGMRTKIEAARIATRAGIELVIAHGRAPEIVARVACGEAVGTRFTARESEHGRPLKGRKRWIAYGRATQGTLWMKPEARGVLLGKGSSLLPIGIERVEGNFAAGEMVSIRDAQGEYGRGLANFDAGEMALIAGHHTSEVAGLLGRAAPREAVHRDNLSPLLPQSIGEDEALALPQSAA